jgi:hypothetical protein
MFSLEFNSNERHTRTQEINYVSSCITLLDSRPRTEFGLSGPQSLDSYRLETCSRLRVKQTLSLTGYEPNHDKLQYQRKCNECNCDRFTVHHNSSFTFFPWISSFFYSDLIKSPSPHVVFLCQFSCRSPSFKVGHILPKVPDYVLTSI